MNTKKVAIACQGGGTHAAFTWGALKEILQTKKRWDTEAGDGANFEISALSGTSAGALCALATWYGLAQNQADPDCGTLEKAMERLDFLWQTFTATTPVEQAANTLVGATLELKKHGVPIPESDPYDLATEMALRGLSWWGAREEYLSFGPLLDSLCPDFSSLDLAWLARTRLRLVVGAIEIHSGNFETFDSHKTLEEMGLRPQPQGRDQYQVTKWRMRRALSLEGVAASGTLPEVLPAQRIPDMVFPTCNSSKTLCREGRYWDGLYSQNPPVRLLLDEPSKDDKPDEIWVIRINPQEHYGELTGLQDIHDRENDLAGNLSLNAELDHILTMNSWISRYGTEHPLLANRKIVTLRTIKMRQETAWGLHVSTKFDRSPQHLHALYAEGREIAAEWLTSWRARGEQFDTYPNDARYSTPQETCRSF